MNSFTNIEHQAQQFCVNNNCGIAVVIIKNGQIDYAKVFGPLTLETPLAVASLSKPIFSYAVLKLCERCVLDLDAPLAEYLPKPYLSDEPFLPLITARHVLSHSTGFPNWRSETGLRATFPPGSAFNYSTEGMIYLQTVVEQVTGQPIQDFIQHQIFEPFSMLQSQFVPEDLSAYLSFLPAGLRAYGGLSLVTTAPDYARFILQMIHSDEDDDFHLSPAMIDEMLRPQVHVGDQRELSWGLGWGLQHEGDQEVSFWHWGARRKQTRNFVIGNRTHQNGLVIFTTHAEGLAICSEIMQTVLARTDPIPAFRWLLPAEKWRADGLVEVL